MSTWPDGRMLRDYVAAPIGELDVVGCEVWEKHAPNGWDCGLTQFTDLQMFMHMCMVHSREAVAAEERKRSAREAEHRAKGIRVCLARDVWDRDVWLLCDGYSGWVYGASEGPAFECGDGRFVAYDINGGVTCPSCFAKRAAMQAVTA